MLISRGKLDTETQTGETLWGRREKTASTSQGERLGQSLLSRPQRRQPCWHLDLRLPASRLRGSTFLLLEPPVSGTCLRQALPTNSYLLEEMQQTVDLQVGSQSPRRASGSDNGSEAPEAGVCIHTTLMTCDSQPLPPLPSPTWQPLAQPCLPMPHSMTTQGARLSGLPSSHLRLVPATMSPWGPLQYLLISLLASPLIAALPAPHLLSTQQTEWAFCNLLIKPSSGFQTPRPAHDLKGVMRSGPLTVPWLHLLSFRPSWHTTCPLAPWPCWAHAHFMTFHLLFSLWGTSFSCHPHDCSLLRLHSPSFLQEALWRGSRAAHIPRGSQFH